MRLDPWIRRLVAVLAGLSAGLAEPAAARAASPVQVRAERGVAAGVHAVPHARWLASIELLAGSRLDLATGRVLAKGQLPTGPIIEVLTTDTKAEDPMRGRSTLALGGDLALQIWRPGGLRPAAAWITRPATGQVSRPDSKTAPASIGAEYISLSAETPDDSPWAYLRILDVSSSALRVEVAIVGGATDQITRDPAVLTADASPSGHRLRWSPAAEGMVDGPLLYSIQRRVIGDVRFDEDNFELVPVDVDTEDPAASPWTSLGTTGVTTFLDPDAPEGRLVEYSVKRVTEAGDTVTGTFGAIVRSVRAETPGEWPLEVGIGARVDLIAGVVVGPGDLAHVEVGRSSPGSLALRPLEGTRFALEAKSARDPEGRDWWLPPPSDRRFVLSRTGILTDGGEIEFSLPGGVVGRVRADAAKGDRWTLRRQIGIDGERLLPRPPRPPVSIDVRAARPVPDGAAQVAQAAAHAIVVTFAPLDATCGVDADAVSLVVERELAYGREDWTVVAEFAPGQRRVVLDGLFRRSANDPLDGSAPIARVRARQRIVFGTSSHAALPIEILAAGEDSRSRRALLEMAISQLDAAEFQVRIEARAVLRKLGDEARPALEAVATGDLGARGVVARSVLESIERGDGSGRGAARRLRRRALKLARAMPPITSREVEDIDSWLGPVPSALVAGGPADRAHGLLVLVDRAERGILRRGNAPGDVGEDCDRARIWSGAVAATDVDQGVRWLARFLSDLGPRPSLASFEAETPYFLMEPGDRPTGDRSGASVDQLTLLTGGSWIELPASADELAWQLERRPELADLDLGPPLARLLQALREAGMSRPASEGTGDDRYFDYDARSAELVLRLVSRARTSPERRTLLAAADAILPGVALDLAARREVSDRRLASPSAAGVHRRTILLTGPDLALLDITLGNLAADLKHDGVDVLLPSGIYHNDEQPGMRLLDIRRSDVRLLPADPDGSVEIRAGIRVRDARNVVIEGIRIRNEGGSALMLIDGAHVVALRARLSGAGSALHVQDSDLEVIECVVDAADIAKTPQWAIRQLGAGRLFARATRFEAGTLFLSEEGRVWLDRCVVDAGPRTLVQAQRAGHLVARETLFRGQNLGLYNVENGVLAAVVLDVPRDPLGRRPTRLRLSPRLFHLVGEGQTAPSSMRLGTEPLERR